MAEKYYIDPSIWMDYYEDRLSGNKKIGEYAFKLLCKLLALEVKIVVSNYILKELERFYSYEQIRGFTSPFERVMEQVSITQEQIKESKILALERNIPKGDALHAIIARDNNAIVISRDHHFEKIPDVCKCVKPEEITDSF